MSPKKCIGAAQMTLDFVIHPIFCDDIFIGVVYIASVDSGVAWASNFISANEGVGWCINLISGSFLAIDEAGQWRLNRKGVTSKRWRCKEDHNDFRNGAKQTKRYYGHSLPRS